MILDHIKEKIAKNLDIEQNIFVYPPSNDLGDLSLPLFSLAKKSKEDLKILSLKIKDKILSEPELNLIVEKVDIAGPYLNFFINKKYLIAETIKITLDNQKNLFYNNIGQQDRVIFEYSNANTHKEIHIGHLRNIVLGDSLVKIFKANGFDAHPVSFINDLGINTAKTVWAYKMGHSQNIGECYSWSVSEIEKKPEISEEISKIMIDIEGKKGNNYQLWKETRELSLKEFDDVYSLLDIKFDKTYFESDFTERGVEIVDNFLKKEIFKKSQGAIIADLEKYNLGVLPVVRSDGTALYAVADLALAEKKNSDFSNLKKSFIVVDVRQSLHFKQLFKILELAGYKNDFTHLAYDFVKLPDGMMSSRSGKIVLLKDLYNQIFNKLVLETKERHQDWSDDKIKENSQKLAVAILKFEMLKVSPNKVITFDIENALKFDGFGALYILYSLVRMKSIVRKSNFQIPSQIDFNSVADSLKDEIEKIICLEISKYGDIIIKAGKDNDPSEVAKYLFSFVKIFNDYYQKVNILQAEEAAMQARVVLIKSCIVLMESAFSLLGIKTNIEEI